jgi:hypothetical protein
MVCMYTSLSIILISLLFSQYFCLANLESTIAINYITNCSGIIDAVNFVYCSFNLRFCVA